MGAKHFGARVARLEDPVLLTGRGRFVSDLMLPGMLHASFVRSPHPHARIRGIDASEARRMPAVRAVLTAGDLPACVARSRIPMLVPSPFITTVRTQLPLAREEVSYVGEIMAVVVAESRHAAEDGADAVSVDFEALAWVSDCRDAVATGAARVHSDVASNIAASVPVAYGDVEAAFAGAARVFEEEISAHRGAAMPLEGRAVLASYDAASDLLSVWSATQTPHLARTTLADLFGRSLELIRVIAPFVGGGFGTKAPFYAEEAVIPAAAMQAQLPSDLARGSARALSLCDAGARSALAGGCRCRCRGKNPWTARQHAARYGSILPWGIIAPYIAATTVPGPYVVPAYRLDLTIALTNRVPTTVVRGAGRPQAVFAMERLVHRIARELGLDRAEVRRRNMVRPEQMPYAVGLLFRDGKPLVYGSGDFPKCLERALSLAAYDEFRSRQVSARAEGRYIGIGIGNYVEGTGLGPFEGVTVRVLPNGKVAVATGATSQGQGTITTLSQIVADAVGCRLENILMTTGDTAAFRRESALSPVVKLSMPAHRRASPAPA